MNIIPVVYFHFLETRRDRQILIGETVNYEVSISLLILNRQMLSAHFGTSTDSDVLVVAITAE